MEHLTMVRLMHLCIATGLLTAAIGCTASEENRSGGAHSGLDSSSTRRASSTPDARTILPGAIGGLELGMTIGEARAKLASASFQRTSDGEGVALVSVSFGDSIVLLLFAGEEDAGAPIDPAKRIEVIEAVGSSFRTAEGIGPGSTVAEAERVYGRTTRVVRSEIESREFIEFERAPAVYLFRLDSTGSVPALHSIAIASSGRE